MLKPTVENLTIGADPEFFIKRNGHYVPAHDFGCGTKRKPMKTKHGFIQVDGLALECNVQPAKTRIEFIQNIQNVMKDLDGYIKEKDKAYTLAPVPSVYFGDKLKDLPREARKLGCEPDWDAYSGLENQRPDEMSDYRTGSGHIHIGWTKNINPRQLIHNIQCRVLVRQLDYYVGLPSILWDRDVIRRRLYGKAGAFRPKSYGVEYRVLSNRWLASGELAGFIYDQVQKAVRAYEENNLLDEIFKGAAQRIINDNLLNWDRTFPEIRKAVL